MTHSTLTPISTSGRRVPARQPIALRTFRTLDPVALAAGKAAAELQYRSSPQRSVAAPRTVLFSGLSWDGVAATDNVGTQFSPPDGGGGINGSYYLEAVNERIAVYNRATTASVASGDLSTFTGLPGTCDPYVMWDQGAQRWVLISIECDSTSAHELSIAYTKSSDPTDLVNGWCKYTVDTGSEFPDYPKAGHNDSDWLVGTNDYNTTTQGFDTAELFAFKKPANGTITTCPALSSDTTGSAASPLTANGNGVFTAEAPDQVDSGAPPASGTASDAGYFVAYGGGNAIHVFKFSRNAAGTASFTFGGDIAIASYSVPGSVPQPGTANTLDSSDTRGVGATAHLDRIRCGGCEAVWMTHTIDGPGGRSQIQWEELNPAACNGSSSCPGAALVQDGLVSSPSLFYFNGRMAPDGNGDEAVLNFDSGSSTQLEQINAVSNTVADPAGGTHGQLLVATSAGYDDDFTCSPCRWGDYAAAETDPANNHTVWNNSMYLAAPDGANDSQWKTRLFAVSPVGPATHVAVALSPPAIVANGTSHSVATATVTDSTGEGVAGDAVGLSSGDLGESVGAVTDRGDGRYTATVTSSMVGEQATITATDTSVSPNVSGQGTLTQIGPPNASLAAPVGGAAYGVGQALSSSFSCTEATGGPGIASCLDQDGHGSPTPIDTSVPGPHTYTVTATSSDGLTGSASATYMIASAPVLWANYGGRKLSLANTGGSGGGDLSPGGASPVGSPGGIAVDLAGGRVYWANNAGGGSIRYANFDGSSPGQLNVGTATENGIRGLVFDAATGRLYWANETGNAISYANVGGGGGDLVGAATGKVSGPAGIAIDAAAGRIYWANDGDNTDPIAYANLADGSNPTFLNVGGATASGARGPSISGGKVYWANFGNNTISFANVDGTGDGGQLPITPALLSQPHGTTIDAAAGKIYWTNYQGNKISSANLDGTGGQDLTTTGATVSEPIFPSLVQAPANTALPQITGTPAVGSTLSCSQGSWAGDDLAALVYRTPASFAYQWLRDGSPIGGATSTTYQLQSADGGHQVSCRVTAANLGGSSNATSPTLSPDTSAPDVSITTPANGATYTQGQVVSASYSCTDPDGPADVASCSGPVASGVAIDTSTTGSHTFTVNAADQVGNSSSQTVSYIVKAASGGGGGGGSGGGGGGGGARTPTVTTSGRVTTTAVGANILVDPGIKLACPGRGSPCSADESATARAPAAAAKAKPKQVVIGRLHFTIRAGRSLELSFKLNTKGAQLLRKLKLLKVTATVVSRVGSNPPITTTKTITITAPARRHRR